MPRRLIRSSYFKRILGTQAIVYFRGHVPMENHSELIVKDGLTQAGTRGKRRSNATPLS